MRILKLDHVALQTAAARAGLRQVDIARKIGWSQSHVSELFNGKQNGNPRTWAALADAIGCEVDDITAVNDNGGDGGGS